MDGRLDGKVGFLIKRSRSSVAHVWTGSDTACRMYSTGGLNQRRYEFAIRPEGRPICANCINLLGYDPSEELTEEELDCPLFSCASPQASAAIDKP